MIKRQKNLVVVLVHELRHTCMWNINDNVRTSIVPLYLPLFSTLQSAIHLTSDSELYSITELNTGFDGTPIFDVRRVSRSLDIMLMGSG